MRRLATTWTTLVMIAVLTLPLLGVAQIQPAEPDAVERVAVPHKVGGNALYIVRLADAPLASYHGNVAGFAPTSPRATGERKLNMQSAAVHAYRSYLAGKRAEVLKVISQALGITPDLVFSYDTAYNGMALRLTPAQATRIARLPGIVSVQREELQHIHTDAGPAFIGATQRNQAPALYKATLTSAQEVPTSPAPNPNASGQGIVVYDGDTNTITFRVTYKGLSGNPTLAHIHQAPAGVAGGVVLDIMPFMIAPGVFAGQATLSDAAETALYADGLYFNVHTAANPAGEIRGQIIGNQGEGMIVGVIDTGINFSHKSFADIGGDGYDHTNPLGANTYVGVCNPQDEQFQAGFVCNDKLIGAWTWPDTADSPSPLDEPSPADDDEHGSHTASTTAGNVVTSTVAGVDTGPLSGVAPHANIIAYDGCTTSQGCPTPALVASIDQAVQDGVDVINFSIGGTTRDPWDDPDAVAFLNAFDAGVLVSVSAGNEGPGPATVGSPSNAPWVMSVGASTHDRVFLNALVGLSAGGSTPPADITGKGFSGGMANPAPIVYAGDFGFPLCGKGETGPDSNPFPPGTFNGQIVVCDRGTYGRVEKAENVLVGGAGGYVLANNQANGDSLSGDLYPLPGVHITYDDGVALKAWLANGSGQTGRIVGATRDVNEAYADIMASFSSRGPDGTLPDVLKPDVTAPGVDILAAIVNTDPNASEFGFISGTSMAAPHNAGAMTLLKALHPDWSVAEIQSALITTGIRDPMRKEDETTPADPFDRGGGRIDVGRAALAGLVLDETGERFASANPAEDGQPSALNRASLANSACVVSCTWTRVFSSTLPTTATWTASISAATGLALTATPSNFTIPTGGTQIVTFRADVSALPFNQYAFAHITFAEQDGLAPDATLPVAVQSVTSDLPDSIRIETDQAAGSEQVNNVTAIRIPEVSVEVAGLTKGSVVSPTVAPDSDTSSPYDLQDGVYLQSVTVPRNSVRFVTEVITTTAVDVDMYVHLDGIDGSRPDGIPQPSELVCASATSVALERCDLDDPPSGRYLVLVQNYTGSGARTDRIDLATAVVPNADADNFDVSVQTPVPAKTPFDVTLSWSLSSITAGDHWYGRYELSIPSSSPLNPPVSLGTMKVDLVATGSSQSGFKVYLPMTTRAP